MQQLADLHRNGHFISQELEKQYLAKQNNLSKSTSTTW